MNENEFNEMSESELRAGLAAFSKHVPKTAWAQITSEVLLRRDATDMDDNRPERLARHLLAVAYGRVLPDDAFDRAEDRRMEAEDIRNEME